jgi:nitrogen-specific signal transduction histidine kinase/CheY-like chemotaxis protein
MAGRYCYDVFCQEKETCQECPVTKSYKSRMVEKSVIDGPDGKVLSMRCYPVQDETGNTIGVVVLSQDITEKRMMESELSKARKLESIGILSGGIAHDYNNLLSVIMGNISLAKLNLKPYDESNKYLDDAEKASKAAKDLSNKLITFSRGGAPNKRETSIAPLLENTVGLALSGSNIQSNFFMADALPTVEIDESQIGQVFHNLVVNAREAMHEGGILRVGAETVRLDEKNILDLNSGEYLKIWIEDSGAGIPEKETDRIFDPYFSTKQRGAQKGMGMGLTICYSIIKNHGGVISVKSPEGTGTTVTIHLPTIIAGQKESVSEHDHPKIQASVGHGLSFNPKVLVMDDEKMVLDIIGKILVRFNYTVEFSTNGADTVDMYKKAFTSGEPFDAVILDLTIRNGIGGRKTLEELIKIDPHVKGIVSSGYSDDPVITDFKAYGFRAALAKPYNMQQLSETMEKILREEE